jgi:hypothetical protein
MIRRHALATASAFLLLATTTVTTRASQGIVRVERHSDARPPTSMATVMRYFGALQPHGLSSHDYSTLVRLYARHVTLTESLSTGRPRTHTGLAQMRAFDNLNTLSWSVLSSQQLSPTVVLTIDHPFTMGPGHELEHAAPWVTRFTISNGTIVDLVWRQLDRSGQVRKHAASTQTR